MKVLLATGGSGGHIFPALQTALELKKRGHEVCFAGALATAQAKIEQAGFRCEHIDAIGFQSRSIPGALRFGFLMTKAFARSLGIVRQLAPDKIVGFGGYGSFPIMLAGCVLRYPTMIHEQNVRPGKTNLLLSKFVKKIAVSFKESIQYFGMHKSVWTGCPCHDHPSARSRKDICDSFGLKPDQKIIALLGGSQGSQRLNEIFFDAISNMKDAQALHMTGKKEHDLYIQKYRQTTLPVVVSAFISPIEELYAIADVVISRAGATTVSELGAFAIPAILVPYPFAGDHQKYNAQVLANAGAALLLEQKDLTVETLLRTIDQCKGPDFARERIAQKLEGQLMKGPAARLADAIEQL